MRLSLVVALLLALAPSAVLAAQAVDPRAEVAAALFAASATQAAVEKADDAKIAAQQAQIVALGRKVRAGQAEQAQLTAAQEQFVAQLAIKDRVYAAAEEAFRGAVTHITETPEGAAALAKFNAGDETGALSILDQLNDARDAALQRATDVQKAVGRRDEAELALDARNRGKVDTKTVIRLFQGVVKLDPGVSSDWLSLASLYADAGQFDDARQAALSAVSAAGDEAQKARAEIALGDVLLSQRKDAAGIIAAYRQAMVLRQALVAANPNDVATVRELEQAVDRLARVLILAGDPAVAEQAYQAILVIAQRVSAANPSDVRAQRDISIILGQLGSLAQARGDLATALKDDQDSLDIARRIAAADPDNAPLARDVVLGLSNVGDLDIVRQDIAAARPLYQEALAIARKLAANDPSDVARQHDVADTSYRVAAIGGGGVTCADVVAQLQALEKSGQMTAEEKAALPAAIACAASGAK